MTTKIERCKRAANDSFSENLAAAVAKKFDGLEIETRFNIFAMSVISVRVDEKEFTPEQHAFIGAYSDGYADAMAQIREPK